MCTCYVLPTLSTSVQWSQSSWLWRSKIWMVKWLFKVEIDGDCVPKKSLPIILNECDWRDDLRISLCVFTHIECTRMQHNWRLIMQLDWDGAQLSDFDIDRVLKPSVSPRRQLRSNNIVSEMKRGWEPGSREGVQNLDGRHKKGGGGAGGGWGSSWQPSTASCIFLSGRASKAACILPLH